MILGQRREVLGARHSRGQSAVEFALVLPFLLVLVLGTADLGRVFVAGIVVESAARNAAEAVANDGRMALLKSPGCTDSSSPPCRAPLYAALHDLAAELACTEALGLPASTDTSGGSCANRLVVAVCIHDHDLAFPQDGDPLCSVIASKGTVPTPGCDPIGAPAMSNVQAGPRLLLPDGTYSVPIRTVEVRLCYRFQPFIGQIFLPLGAAFQLDEIYLNHGRVFPVMADWGTR